MENSRFFDGLEFNGTGIRTRAVECGDAYPLYYGIQYIHSGPFYLKVNDGPLLKLKGPAAFLTSPDSRFAYGSEKNTFREHYHVCASGPRIQSYLESGLFVPAARREQPYYPILAPNLFLSHMLELIQLSRSEEQHDFAVAKYEFILLFLQKQTVQHGECGYYLNDLERLSQQIMISPEQDWDFAAEAEKLHISLKHFIRIFRERCGEPPRRFVLHQRLYKASTLLIQSRESVKSIAWQCGFQNEFYFSRAFKKFLMLAPEDYRKTHRHSL